jgi:hypothetical protein
LTKPIEFKSIESYFTEDDKAVIANTAKLNANGKTQRAKRDALTARIDKGETASGPNITSRIANLIEGKPVGEVASLEAQRLEILYGIRDNEDALDYLAGKEKTFRTVAGAKMVEAAKTQIVASEKEIYDAVQTLFNAFLPYWHAKRHLLNNGHPTLGQFTSPLDELLGVPVDVNSGWADIFRHGVAAGHIRKTPKELAPK